jgi:hypothetical protein
MKTNLRYQCGFAILSLVLTAIVLLAVVSAVVAVSRTGTSSAADMARPYASAVITQGNNLALAFQRFESNGTLPTYITYGACTNSSCSPATPAANDVLNISNTSLTLQTPPDKAFSGTATAAKKIWIFKSSTVATASGSTAGAGQLKVPGVGNSGTADFAFVLTDLDQTVCQDINLYLTNSTTIPVAATAGATLANFQGSAVAPFTGGFTGATDGTSVDMTATSTSPVPSGQMQGCVQTSDGKYVYFVVAEPQ